MKKKQLRLALENAAQAVPPDTPMHQIHMWMFDAHIASPRADKRATRLLVALGSESELDVFDGKLLHVVSIAAHAVERWHLGAWLINRTQSVGATQALEDVSRYLKTTDIPCEVAVVFCGLEPEGSYPMGRGISLLPWTKLPSSSQKGILHERTFMEFPFNRPTGAITRKYKSKKRYIPQDQIQQHLQEYKVDLDDISDFSECLMCLSLIGPNSPMVLAEWVTAPAWCPITASSLTSHHIDGFCAPYKISAGGSRQARGLFEAFSTLPKPLKERLALVVYRLTRAMRHVVQANAAIDLGIALEALYLGDQQDDRGELSFRLRARAARFLARTEPERRDLFRLFGDIYSIRSSAVHTGTIRKANYRGRTVKEVLDQGFSLTADAVRRVVTHGEPDWDTVVLG